MTTKKKATDARRLRHLGLTGPRIPCAKQPCEFFAVKRGLCTNCYAAHRRAQPHVAQMEKENKARYLAKPGVAERIQAVRRVNKRSYYQTPEYKAKKRAYYTSTVGRAQFAARTAGRRAAKLAATPAWLTGWHKRVIRRVYEIAGRVGCHVDHIAPLKGKHVSGLHVPWNLAIKPARLNIAKGNRVTQEELNSLWEIRKSTSAS